MYTESTRPLTPVEAENLKKKLGGFRSISVEVLSATFFSVLFGGLAYCAVVELWQYGYEYFWLGKPINQLYAVPIGVEYLGIIAAIMIGGALLQLCLRNTYAGIKLNRKRLHELPTAHVSVHSIKAERVAEFEIPILAYQPCYVFDLGKSKLLILYGQELCDVGFELGEDSDGLIARSFPCSEFTIEFDPIFHQQLTLNASGKILEPIQKSGLGFNYLPPHGSIFDGTLETIAQDLEKFFKMSNKEEWSALNY